MIQSFVKRFIISRDGEVIMWFFICSVCVIFGIIIHDLNESYYSKLSNCRVIDHFCSCGKFFDFIKMIGIFLLEIVMIFIFAISLHILPGNLLGDTYIIKDVNKHELTDKEVLMQFLDFDLDETYIQKNNIAPDDAYEMAYIYDHFRRGDWSFYPYFNDITVDNDEIIELAKECYPVLNDSRITITYSKLGGYKIKLKDKSINKKDFIQKKFPTEEVEDAN